MYNIKSGKGDFKPLPDDRYILKVDGVSVTPHTKDGTDGHRFEVAFTIIEGENKGRKVWDNIYLPWATWKMFSLLDAGESPAVNDENATPDSIAAALTGLEVSAYLTTTLNDGKTRTKVSEYKSVQLSDMLTAGEQELDMRLV